MTKVGNLSASLELVTSQWHER